MRPKQPPKADHDDLFRARLDSIINMRHDLVLLGDRIDWHWIDEQPGQPLRHGRPAGGTGPLHDRHVPAEAHLFALRQATMGALGA